MKYVWRPGPGHNHLFSLDPTEAGDYKALCGITRKNIASRIGIALKFCSRCSKLGEEWLTNEE